MTKVKICGITNKEDAFWASSLGADFVGLNFYKNSLRKVSVNNAKEIVSSLPPYTTPVAVFVNEQVDQIIKICNKTKIIYAQLHGSEDINFCQQLKNLSPQIKIIKVIKVKPENMLQNITIQEYSKSIYSEVIDFYQYIDYILFDTYIDSEVGGTGTPFCWQVIVEIKNLLVQNNIDLHYFVAGGLNVENVEEVVTLLSPWCVDVSSGVERLPRRKDYQKMKDFIRKVKSL
ncbi:MAG: phosphoribosylanthranilate isomerase [Endomicrobia bacterium]|nr:phosphoribosylanthranilate isomerase [Endomicrobiia bacterium]